jgi:hypothetical protein
MRKRILRGLTATVALLALVLLAAESWQIYGYGGWRDMVYRLTKDRAIRQAQDDFREGHLRLYRLGGKQEKAQPTGESNGVFAIWVPQFNPGFVRAHRYSTEKFVEFYNRTIQASNASSGGGYTNEPNVQRDGPANGGQPIRSETNRTSSAVGSRR